MRRIVADMLFLHPADKGDKSSEPADIDTQTTREYKIEIIQ